MADDLILTHARITTQIETVTVEAALRAGSAGDSRLAHDLWIAGFNAEHYWASLDVVPEHQTPDQLARFDGLMQLLDDLLRREAVISNTPYSGTGVPPQSGR